MQYKTLLLLISTLFFAACSSTPAPPIQAERTQDKQVVQKGFSLLFPDQHDWKTVQNAPYRMIMTKKGASEDERYTIQVLLVKLPAFDTDDSFQQFVSNKIVQNQKKSDAMIVEQQTRLVDGKNKKCIQHSSKEKVTNRANRSMLDVVSFTCTHSSKRNVGVYLAYSKNYAQGKADKEINLQAEKLFGYLEMVSF